MHRTINLSAGRRVSPARFAIRRVFAATIALILMYFTVVGAVQTIAMWTVV